MLRMQTSMIKPMARLLPFIMACLVAMPARSEDVTMAFGEKIPPYCFPETNSGIEIEVIGEALAYRGHRLKPVYYPFARVPVAFAEKKVDATMTDLGADLSRHGGFYGDPAVTYDNVLITLKRRHLVLRKPADLAGLSVVAFRGAAKRYPDWLGPVQKAGRYYEINDQSLQVKTLMRGRYDVVLSDRNIFRYFTLQVLREGDAVQAVDMHAFTKVNPLDYRPVFRSEQVRNDFNDGLKHLKQTGRFQQIYDAYLKQ